MKREELKEILENAGLDNSKNTIDLIMSKYGNGINELKKQNETLASQYENVAKDFETFKTEKTQLEEKLSSFGDYESILTENKTLKQQQEISNNTAKLKELNVAYPDLVYDKLDFTKDLAAQVESLKEKYPNLFGGIQPQRGKVGLEQQGQKPTDNSDFSDHHARRKQRQNRQ